MKTLKLTLSAVMAATLLTSCATRGPTRVTALPMPGPTVSPTNWAVVDAPRQQPGKLMDPDAVTYAQVPSRIIYMPGDSGIFGRRSARQEVAYNLVPVDRIPAIQAQGTPVFESRAPAETSQAKSNVFTAVFPGKDGASAKGTARRLGVLGKTDVEKTRAQSLLAKGETLHWAQDVGWVGFTEEIVVRPPLTTKKSVDIPALPDSGTTKSPDIKAPDAGEEKPGKETQKSVPDMPGTDGKPKTAPSPSPSATPDAKDKDRGAKVPETPASPAPAPIKLNKTLGIELSVDE